MHLTFFLALSYQWSVFRFSNDQPGLDAVKSDVMKSAMTSPVAWCTVLFAGGTHHAFNHKMGRSPKFNDVLRLTYKNKAIRYLSDEISKGAGTVSDEVLLSIVTLAAHGSGEVPEPPNSKSWTTSVLSSAHNLDFFGGMKTAWVHVNALRLLVEQRGGLHTVKLKAAMLAIQLYDAFIAWRSLEAPVFPLVQPTSHFMSMRKQEPDSIALALSSHMNSGFRSLQNSDDSTPLQRLLQSVSNAAVLSVDLDQWCRKTTSLPDMVHLQYTRWCVLHDLLSLPDLSPTLDQSEDVQIYEMIRLSALAYILFTLVPIPQAGSLPQSIAEKLRVVLEACVAESERGKGICVRQPVLFQWSVILGGMCAFAAHAQEAANASTCALLNAYASLTRHLSVKPEIRAWSLIVNLLGQYLWLESECNELGQTFWRYACESGG